MYGLVNKAIQDMVCKYHGEDTWETIKRKAELEDIDFFIGMDSYADDVTYRLVEAACEVLNTPAHEILKAFGEYWVNYTAEEGYGELLASAGTSLPQFIENLDNLHARVGLSFSELCPPSFECEHQNDHSMKLHYQSNRKGLAPMVIGLLHGLGKRFHTNVDVIQTNFREQGDPHDIFSIKYSDSQSNDQ
ncbi:heme NO-binding domain-containing protein [Nostoc sp. FACHB-152]|uniref:heme NO-binding domain-containing protein n=1 Tax=unclassified Nostoc TaxID=2593658 RepID=UPI0016896FAB|nr:MULTISPECIES: heme NO-binding domain-containing protein [unclassified Nostoc]MBD2448130.1 heme NO-binding domain-containing protein [Nostoc sp. FACHB-152]MBD2467122.1 heme NO-binding domain-containing protein [Nostoc sp. FACHB-145]